MPRLRNVQTGVVVSCSEATAARLVGSDWAPADAPTPAKKATAKKAAPAAEK